MKKIVVVIGVIVIILILVQPFVFAKDTDGAKDSQAYKEISDVINKYDTMNFMGDISKNNHHNIPGKIFEKISDALFSELKKSLKTLVSVVLICTLLSVLKAFISKSALAEVSEYGVYCICGVAVLLIFKTINDACINTIDNLSDFMDIAVPTYVIMLTGCGYATMAISVQSLFMSISLLITHVIKDVVCPVLFCSGLLSVVSGVSDVINLSGFIALISKTIKYILGVIMTIFAGVMVFSGLSSSATDSLAVQTAKFAISNFVPVVGGCLSSALNGMKQSSILLKNNMGFAGFLILISFCIMPVLKIFVSVFSLKLGASIVHMFSETKLAAMLDSVCDVLVTMGSLVIFVAVIYILIIGVIASVG